MAVEPVTAAQRRLSRASVPEGWKVVHLGDVFKQVVDTGHSLDLPVLSVTVNGEVVRRSSLDRKSDREVPREKYLRVKPGDIAYNTMRMWQGASGLVQEEGYISPAYTVCRPRADESPEFWTVYFRYEPMVRSFLDHSQGFAKDRYRLYFHHFSTVPALRPPFGEQHTIAASLASVDEAIKKSEAAAKQIKIAKDQLTQELLARGLPGRHIRLRESPIGKVPEDWNVCSIREILIESAYGTSTRCEATAQGLPVIRIPNVVAGRITTDNLKFAQLTANEIERFRLRPGDLLIVRTNGNPEYVGRSAVFENPSGIWLYASYLIRLRLDGTRIAPAYLHAALQSQATRRRLSNSIRTSAGNYNLNAQGIAETVIPLPGIEEQVMIVAALTVFDERIDAEEAAYSRLTEAKSALLQALLTGEIRVKPAEALP